MKKWFSIILAAAVVITSVVILSGCSDSNYPVRVANITIEKEPENIVVLDAPTADIISFMSFDKKWAGRSDEVDQEWLGIVPSVGSSSEPDVEKIKSFNTDIVFAGDDLNSEIRKELEKNNIKVITMSRAQNAQQLETNYLTLGKILGGNTSGKQEGEKSYENLISEMELLSRSVKESKTTDVLDTVCYLYVNDDKLRMKISGTYVDMLIGYTGAVNCAVNMSNDIVDVNTLKIANPNYIFYADNDTLDKIKNDKLLSALTAVKTKKMLMVTANDVTRQGQSASATLQKMIYFMYPSLDPAHNTATADQTATVAAATTAPVPSATEADGSQAASTSVASKYKITVTNKLSLKPENENKYVKAMQQRLFDLGYIDDKDNITGYYGEISQKAVKEFQEKNNINPTGVADNSTLVIMFDSNAVEAE